MGIRSSKSKNLYKGLDVFKSGDLNKTVSEELPLLASGGSVITSGNERFHVFLQPGEFKVGVGFGKTVDILIVAGGGGGGSPYYAGGGGGGGVVFGPAISLETGSYSILVGSGGYADNRSPSTTYTPGGSGGNSGFGTVFANGGGGGGSYSGVQYQEGGIGGSAGGPSYYVITSQIKKASKIPASYIHYGNDSAVGQGGGGAGGGGAGTAGGVPSPSPTGNRKGGDGRAFPQFPAPIIAPAIPSPVRVGWANTVGSLGYYAGGGGAAAYPTGAGGAGGLGGGGNGSPHPSTIPATAGFNYTGGGGGGSTDPAQGAAFGGSGIVIIKYIV